MFFFLLLRHAPPPPPQPAGVWWCAESGTGPSQVSLPSALPGAHPCTSQYAQTSPSPGPCPRPLPSKCRWPTPPLLLVVVLWHWRRHQGVQGKTFSSPSEICKLSLNHTASHFFLRLGVFRVFLTPPPPSRGSHRGYFPQCSTGWMYLSAAGGHPLPRISVVQAAKSWKNIFSCADLGPSRWLEGPEGGGWRARWPKPNHPPILKSSTPVRGWGLHPASHG